MNDLPRPELSRRRFLSQTSLGLAAVSTLSGTLARGSAANSRLRLGLVGCGGRGAWIADLFAEHGGYEIAAVADYFQDKVEKVAQKFQLPAQRQFTGLKCAEKMIAQGGIDAVAIISPPYFHPAQAKAAVDAGLHVDPAKPVAVDVPGCLSTSGTRGAEARRKGQVFLVDFQTRTNEFYVEAVRRVHDGALIGDFCFGEAIYHDGRLNRKADPGPPEARLRNWVFDRALSGDIIVEQNIHTLNVHELALPRNSAAALHRHRRAPGAGRCRRRLGPLRPDLRIRRPGRRHLQLPPVQRTRRAGRDPQPDVWHQGRIQ